MRAGRRHGGLPRALVGLGLVLALVGAAAGCSGGGDKKTNGLEGLAPAEVGSRAVTTLRTAPGVHLSGSVTSPGGDAPADYDLVLSPTTTRGTVEEYGQQTQLVKIKADTYVRRARSYYTATGDSAAADLLADRWVRLAAADAAKYSYFTLNGFSDSLRSYLVGLAGKVEQEKVDGERAVRVRASDGTTFEVANTGPAYPLRITLAGDSTTRLRLADFRTPDAATAPSSPIDLSSIG
ncbi:hypothetical protein MXD61_23080 [Frankia sp. AgPm24]|uniref:hypothetical protein n=1 Tax=Frankia sp. AgPm24 TaxID=631128 RepID=UPI00200BB19B|nr:hypothetical protein [Frankia sp. AgPm24]MCK9924712.1 hypothetical protein [Frankia sp. AgPm24]